MTPVELRSTIERNLVYLLAFLAVCIAAGLIAYGVRVSVVPDLSETLTPVWADELAFALRAIELAAVYCGGVAAVVALGFGIRVLKLRHPLSGKFQRG